MTRHLHIVREIVVTPMELIYFDTKGLRIRVKHHQSCESTRCNLGQFQFPRYPNFWNAPLSNRHWNKVSIKIIVRIKLHDNNSFILDNSTRDQFNANHRFQYCPLKCLNNGFELKENIRQQRAKSTSIWTLIMKRKNPLEDKKKSSDHESEPKYSVVTHKKR